ncbi:MAG: response regulator [Pseudomonadota bacterium]
MKHNYLFGFLLCLLCLCLCLFFIIYVEAREKAIFELNSRQMIHARQAQRGIEDFFSNLIASLIRIRASDHIVNLDDIGRRELDFASIITPEEITAFTRVDAAGRIIYTSPYDIALIGKDLSGQKHVQEILNTHHPVVSDVFTAVQGYPAIAVHVPVISGDQFRGTLGALIDFKAISSRFLGEIRIGETGHAWMTNREGTELYCAVAGRPGESVIENCKDFPAAVSMAKEMMREGEGATTFLFHGARDKALETVKKHAVYLPVRIGDTFWSIVVVSSEEEVLASLVNFRNKLIGVFSLLLIGGAFFTYFGVKARWLVREASARQKAGETLRERESALRESEDKFRTLVEKSPLGIALIEKDGRYTYINPRFTEMFGYAIEDIRTGAEWFKKAYPDKAYRHRVVKAWIEDQHRIGPGQTRPRVYTVTCKGGSRKEIYFRPVTMEKQNQFVIYEDITDKTELELQLQQAQKYEAIGTLAGGVAHDFNNLLMGIQGRASLLRLYLPPSDPHLEHVDAIEECIRSAANLTRQLLGFARGGKYEVHPIDINEVVRGSSILFGRARKEIRIHTRLFPLPLVVEADRGQIEQVLLNLYVNAWQAMPGGGELSIETASVSLDDEFSKLQEVKPGYYGRVSVTDTGIGMDGSTRQRIFDPFFTTKEKSRGTGLGLASAYGIIKNHGGLITVDSEKGRGASFKIYLPLSEKEALKKTSVEETLVRGSETLLIVDDEEMILEVGEAMLTALGYRVIVARSGGEAVAVVKNMATRIDLVILDLVMPGMDGGKAFDLIHELRPALPVMLSSGYAINSPANEILRRGARGFIQKPFNISVLSKKISEMLVDSPKPGGRRSAIDSGRV